jgi:hypothetical protein
MRKFVLILLLLGTPAWAEWTPVGVSSGLQMYYADLGTIRRQGNLVEMWTLIDHKSTQRTEGIVFSSGKAQYEYDCDGGLRRLLSYELHSGRMGDGEVVYTDGDPSAWEATAPDSVAERLWKMACKR